MPSTTTVGVAVTPTTDAAKTLVQAPATRESPVAVLPSTEVAALRAMLAELGRVVETLRVRQRDTIAGVTEAAVELGVALAERLVSTEIAANRQRLDRIVRDTLERMQPAQTIAVRGHADDIALLQQQLNDHAELQPHRTMLTFRPERDGRRGVLKVEADEWFVEWDTQRSLADLRDALLEETFADE